MAKHKVIEDKLYYFTEKTGIPKSEWHRIFDVGEVTLRKWSYNPENVSPETHNHIMKRIAMFDALHIMCTRTTDIPKLAQVPELCSEYTWRIYSSGKSMLIGGCSLGDFVNMLIEEAIVTCPEAIMQKDILSKRRLLNGQLCRIANNDLYEIPAGIFVWDESLTGLANLKEKQDA